MNPKIKLEVDMSEVDEALKKVEKIKELLVEIEGMIGSLGSGKTESFSVDNLINLIDKGIEEAIAPKF